MSESDLLRVAQSLKAALDNEIDELETNIIGIKEEIEAKTSGDVNEANKSPLIKPTIKMDIPAQADVIAVESRPVPPPSAVVKHEDAMSFRAPKYCTKCNSRLDTMMLASVLPGHSAKKKVINNNALNPLCSSCKEKRLKEKKNDISIGNKVISGIAPSKPQLAALYGPEPVVLSTYPDLTAPSTAVPRGSLAPVADIASASRPSVDLSPARSKSKFRDKLQAARDEKHFLEDVL